MPRASPDGGFGLVARQDHTLCVSANGPIPGLTTATSPPLSWAGTHINPLDRKNLKGGIAHLWVETDIDRHDGA